MDQRPDAVVFPLLDSCRRLLRGLGLTSYSPWQASVGLAGAVVNTEAFLNSLQEEIDHVFFWVG